MKKLLIPLAILIFGISLAYAAPIKYMESITLINNDNSANTKLAITLEYPQSEVTIPILYHIKNLETSANFPSLECFTTIRPYGTDVTCDTSRMAEDKRIIKLDFNIENVAKKVNDQLLFKREIYIPYDTDSLYAQISLPEGAGLIKSESPYSPGDGIKAIDSEGRRIFIFWTRSNLPKTDIFTVQLSYESFAAEQDIILLVAGVVIILIAAFYLYKKRYMRKAILPILKEDEKRVISGLIKHGDGVNQKLLVRESGYSKAKVSKVLKSLVERGLVKLDRVGRTNMVYWDDKYKKQDKTA